MKSQTVIDGFLHQHAILRGGLNGSQDCILSATEDNLPAGIKFPSVFKKMYASHAFDSFVVAQLEFLGNHGRFDSALWQHFERHVDFINECCALELLPFARCMTGSFDPVCFDLTANKRSRGDFPVVIVDHESILLGRSKASVRPVAKVLLPFMKSHIGI
jgi:hypothetical protein